MLRFVHTADLHLDSPLKSLALRDPELRDLVADASRSALARIVDLCLAEEVAFLLIAGDLFDGAVRSMKTAAFVAAQMERLNAAGIPVFLVRGNHDAASKVAERAEWPPNVHLFSARGETVVREDMGVALHGASFPDPQALESLLPRYPAPRPGLFNIGLLHTSLGGAAGHDPYAPCSVEDLRRHGYDYWALGHIHGRTVHSEAPWIVMPGMPQGRDMGEAGAMSVTLAAWDGARLTLEPRAVAPVTFRRAVCDLEGEGDWRAALARIEAVLDAAQTETGAETGAETVLRLELVGRTPLAWRMRRDADLLGAQVAESARTRPGLWIEAVRQALAPPEAEAGDPRAELAALMAEVAGEPGFLHEAQALVEDLVGALPVEARDPFGATGEAREAVVRGLAEAGVAEMAARLMGLRGEEAP